MSGNKEKTEYKDLPVASLEVVGDWRNAPLGALALIRHSNADIGLVAGIIAGRHQHPNLPLEPLLCLLDDTKGRLLNYRALGAVPALILSSYELILQSVKMDSPVPPSINVGDLYAFQCENGTTQIGLATRAGVDISAPVQAVVVVGSGQGLILNMQTWFLVGTVSVKRKPRSTSV